MGIPEQQELREMIQSIVRSLGLLEREQIGCYGVTTQQAHTLTVISEASGITMGALSERLGIATSTLTRNIAKLEQDGLVTRSRTSDDARAVQVALTDAGRAKLVEVEECYTKSFSIILQCIAPEDRETVIKGFQILLRAVRECSTCC